MAAFRMTPTQWREEYAETRRAKEVFRKPYLAAVAPIFAEAIKHSGKKSVSVLVIGGGDGVFSKHMLPAIRELVSKGKSKVRIRVVESDIVPEALAQAPGKRVVADAMSLPFGKETFDFVVGESMIHPFGEPGVDAFIKEARRVLAPKGFFIHVQDHYPDARIWAPAVFSQTEYGKTGTARIITPYTASSMEEYTRIARAAHANLSSAIVRMALKHGFNTLSVPAQKSVKTPLTKLPPIQGNDLSANNVLFFRRGIINGGVDVSLKRNERVLGYEGVVHILSARTGQDLGILSRNIEKVRR